MDIVNKWGGTRFVSSSGLTPEFQKFAGDYKRALKELLCDYDLVSWSRGHFYCSAFFKHIATGKYIYLNCSDVRYSQDHWYKSILVRTAKDDKDYTGGSNNWATLETLEKVANGLIK